jgi:hypothetical protein
MKRFLTATAAASAACLILLLTAAPVRAQFGDLLGSIMGDQDGGGGRGGPLGDGCFDLFQCPDGSVPDANPTHTPSSNGCGSAGMDLGGGDWGLETCCDTHDYCYDTCGTSRTKCDADFSTCLTGICRSPQFAAESQSSCQSTASLYSMGASGFGCGSFITAQHQACHCQGRLAETVVQEHEALQFKQRQPLGGISKKKRKLNKKKQQRNDLPKKADRAGRNRQQKQEREEL